MPRFASNFYIFLTESIGKRVPARLQPMWNHEAGPKTVFFWSPFAKWTLVIAGIGDMYRPAEKLSLKQSSALCVTGFIWSRYCLVIQPRVWLLFAVNFLTGCTGLSQLGRIANYRYYTLPALEAEAAAKGESAPAVAAEPAAAPAGLEAPALVADTPAAAAVKEAPPARDLTQAQ